ncbi:hypothetical protein H312_01649 [Anncaliia algerae PRA339]|uniref:Uncharacterized protein n=1 Tax=Anncaliia algerae PRA339 TaxID=1288291 RepID=A0A059F1S5_9MICR|nr:hypothetical protein H312_01649 [Anncaliia algerae PRA339]
MNLRTSKIIIVYLMQECFIKCSYSLETETKSEKITQNNDSNSQQQNKTENYQKCVSKSEENCCIPLYNIEMGKNTECCSDSIGVKTYNISETSSEDVSSVIKHLDDLLYKEKSTEVNSQKILKIFLKYQHNDNICEWLQNRIPWLVVFSKLSMKSTLEDLLKKDPEMSKEMEGISIKEFLGCFFEVIEQNFKSLDKDVLNFSSEEIFEKINFVYQRMLHETQDVFVRQILFQSNNLVNNFIPLSKKFLEAIDEDLIKEQGIFLIIQKYLNGRSK